MRAVFPEPFQNPEGTTREYVVVGGGASFGASFQSGDPGFQVGETFLGRSFAHVPKLVP